MGRKPMGATRSLEIIRAFYAVAREVGLENASISRVGEHMGISNGLVMHYFKTKDELLIGLNDYILQQHMQVMLEGHRGQIRSRKDLEELIRNLFSRKWNQYFDDGVFYSCYALIYRNEAFKDSFKAYLLELHRVLRDELQQARENGIIENENIDSLAEIIFALVDGSYYYLGMFDQGDALHKSQQETYIAHCLQLFKYSVS
ncbi:TetR family transcriptional regulator [Robertkochia solimangrovi]|uniref:TetR family transcriptional regulator n=1 Tax=Robertkochia solimangrovi TaxID=2213046 RepID=UPI00117C2A67|nr:TetR family transcriptional regulator [Robertkochia solimangrovi]TRZ41971.1 TetR/AcrR family transcriptional regulator [Robertkochia solimangrovi]